MSLPAKKVLLWIGSPGAMAAANTATRSAAATCRLELVVDRSDGRDNGATTKDFVRRLPPHGSKDRVLICSRAVGGWQHGRRGCRGRHHQS
jgi:hypothetical protein